MDKLLKRLAWLTSFGMLFVLLGGALVTKTESGRGCGTDWPLCNGKFIPAYTLESLIEYSHRMVSGVVGLLVLTVFVFVLMFYRQRKDFILFAGSALFFTVLQAALGALAVIVEQNSAVKALHFGFSLLAFSSTLLLTIFVARLHHPAHSSGWGEARLVNGSTVSLKLQGVVWSITIYSYVVVYIGAYVRHTGSVAGCTGWPLCNGEFFPGFAGEPGIAFIHRLAALALFSSILYLLLLIRRHYKTVRELLLAGQAAFLLVLSQVLSGALIVFTLHTENLYVFTALLHTVIIATLFGVLCYMSMIVWLLQKYK